MRLEGLVPRVRDEPRRKEEQSETRGLSRPLEASQVDLQALTHIYEYLRVHTKRQRCRKANRPKQQGASAKKKRERQKLYTYKANPFGGKSISN